MRHSDCPSAFRIPGRAEIMPAIDRKNIQCDTQHRLSHQRLDQRRRRRAAPVCEPNSFRLQRVSLQVPPTVQSGSAKVGASALPRALLSRRRQHDDRPRVALGDRSGHPRHALRPARRFPTARPVRRSSTAQSSRHRLSLGIRHRFDPRWTVMGTVEWSNWSRIGTVNVNQLNGARRWYRWHRSRDAPISI